MTHAISHSLYQLQIYLVRFRLLALLAIALSACMPIPTVRQDLKVPKPHFIHPEEAVALDFHVLEGYPEPHTPNAYNKAPYLRYALRDASEPPQRIFIFVSGIYGSAASMENLALQVVRSQENAEVWVHDRRSTILEDRSAILEAIEQKNPQIAYDYYIENLNKTSGFKALDYDEVDFMRYWGLEVHLQDLHRVVLEARANSPEVVLVGHSLAASIVGFYAAYQPTNFNQAGHEYIDKLVLIDGGLGRTGGFNGYNIGPIPIVEAEKDLSDDFFSSNDLAQLVQLGPFAPLGFRPELYAKREVEAVYALLDPEGLSPFYDFPMSNLAAFAHSRDDQFSPSTIFSATIGFPEGADFTGNPTALFLEGLDGLESRFIEGLAPGYDKVSWTSGDPKREHTDAERYVKLWVNPYSNFNEWYFPLKLAVDISRLDVSLDDTPHFISNSQVDVPTLAVGGGRGLVRNIDVFAAYSNSRAGSLFSSYVIPGFTHNDMIAAEDNPLVFLMDAWLKQFDSF